MTQITEAEERHVLIETEKANEAADRILCVLGLGGGGIDMPQGESLLIDQILWRLQLLQKQLSVALLEVSKL